MDDKELLDTLYQLWAKTTGAETCYWDYQGEWPNDIEVAAVSQDGDRKWIASLRADEDADFITAIHGCLPDLIRMCHEALDEADRADHNKDSRECRIAELEMEVAELKADLEGLING